MHEVITDLEQVTPEWLTKILLKKGSWSQNGVSAVKALNRTQYKSTWFADIVSLEVTYAGKAPKSIPNRLLLKISKPNLTPADLVYGSREVEFYNIIATAMDVPPTVCCYDAAYAPDSGRSHVLLEDLSETHFQPEFPLPPSETDCGLAMDCLARFHAQWWGNPRLEKEIGFLSTGEQSKPENFGLPHSRYETEDMFPGFANFLGDRLPVERRRLYEEILSTWPFSRWAERFQGGKDITLIHGDAHAWNFLYPRDPKRDSVCIIDWQEWCINLGTKDLTEMIVLWWYPEQRARLEESLVQRYHRRLIEYGVQGYGWEQCWHDYRLSAISILLYPVWMYASGRSPAFWWPILEKSTLAYQDLDCAELLV